MNQFGEVVGHDGDVSLVRLVSPACTSCHRSCESTRLVAIPRHMDGKVRFTMSNESRHILLLHSLWLPLAGFVGGASLGDWMFGSDAGALGLSVFGLFFGLLACKRQPISRIEIEEAKFQ